MDGPDKLYLVAMCCLDQLLHLAGFCGGVVLSPFFAMVGIVLGTVDVDVHLVAAVKFKLPDAVRLAPVVAVETLDNTTLGHVGPVLHRDGHHFGLAGNLLKGLHAVESSLFVVSGNDHAARGDAEVVALGYRGNFTLIGCHGSVAAFADNDFHVCGVGHFFRKHLKQGCCIGVCLIDARKCKGAGGGIALGHAGKSFLAPGDFLRDGRDGHLLCGCGPWQRTCEQGDENLMDFHGI